MDIQKNKNTESALPKSNLDKKVWSKPTIEIISSDDILSGRVIRTSEGITRSGGHS